MSIVKSFFLGVLQGITEFLPISSSAHLVFLQRVFDINENVLLFDVLLHFSTMLSVIVVFYKDIMEYLRSKKIILYIIVATIPTGIIGLVIKKYFEYVFVESIYASIFLIVTGILLFFSEKIYLMKVGDKKKILKIGWLKSLVIGISQGVAVLPGISRSGATLSTTMFLGIEKEDAIKFIFIMSLPAILSATILEIKDLIFSNQLLDFEINYMYGMVSAFIFGSLSLKFLVNFVQRNTLKYFSYYCVLVGVFTLIFLK